MLITRKQQNSQKITNGVDEDSKIRDIQWSFSEDGHHKGAIKFDKQEMTFYSYDDLYRELYMRLISMAFNQQYWVEQNDPIVG